MQYAITTLQLTIRDIKESERMHRDEGEIASADREAVRANELMQAIAILTAVRNGSIRNWPEPK